MRFENQVAFITGASRGIGAALAVGLARAGCDIVLAAKTDTPHPTLPGTIFSVADEVRAVGRRALPFKCNVRREADIDRAVDAALATFGRIDFLINNAGAIHIAGVEEMDARRYDLVMEVNVRAAYLCARAVLPAMKAQGGGHILMMSPPQQSRAPGKTAYALSKFGMTFVAQSLAEEVREHGIAVNALWPITGIDSQATRHFWPGQEAMWRTPQIMVDAVLAIFARPPAELTGAALYDEDVLRAAGVTNFAPYAAVAGAEPPPFSRDLMRNDPPPPDGAFFTG